MRTGIAQASLLPSKGLSLHRQLFLVLRDQIMSGMYAEGRALPTEEALCDVFGVSRITVRRSLADLAAQGLVERRQGLGTFVRDDLPRPRRLPNLSLVDALKRSSMETDVKVLEVSQAAPPRDVATQLQLDPDTLALHAIRLRSIDGVPVMVTDAWVSNAFRKGVTASQLGKSALYEILMAGGVKFGRVIQEFTAASANRMTSEALGVELGSPMLKVIRLMHDDEERPVLHLTAYVTPDRSRVLMDIPSGRINTMIAGQFVHDLQRPNRNANGSETVGHRRGSTTRPRAR